MFAFQVHACETNSDYSLLSIIVLVSLSPRLLVPSSVTPQDARNVPSLLPSQYRQSLLTHTCSKQGEKKKGILHDLQTFSSLLFPPVFPNHHPKEISRHHPTYPTLSRTQSSLVNRIMHRERNHQGRIHQSLHQQLLLQHAPLLPGERGPLALAIPRDGAVKLAQQGQTPDQGKENSRDQNDEEDPSLGLHVLVVVVVVVVIAAVQGGLTTSLATVQGLVARASQELRLRARKAAGLV